MWHHVLEEVTFTVTTMGTTNIDYIPFHVDMLLLFINLQGR